VRFLLQVYACTHDVLTCYNMKLLGQTWLTFLHVLQVYIQPWDTSTVMPGAPAAARTGSNDSGEHLLVHTALSIAETISSGLAQMYFPPANNSSRGGEQSR
jgi:hypothetical protein